MSKHVPSTWFVCFSPQVRLRGVRKLKVKCLQTAVLGLDMNWVSQVLEHLL